MLLPDALTFDPVHFPGLAEGEVWPPPRFDFTAPWLATPDLAFERGASGAIIFVRRCDSLRLVLDLETAHAALDIVPRCRDFRLLRLMPTALRFVERIIPGDEVPPPLHDAPLVLPAEHHIYAATTALVAAVERSSGAAGSAFLGALRRTPPGPGMFEMAAAQCIAVGGYDLQRVASMAKGLQRLANAHAEVLAAHAIQPDYLGMEHMVAATARILTRDAQWTNNLLAHALQQLNSVIARPRQTAEALRAAAVGKLEVLSSLTDAVTPIEYQARMRDRLLEMAVFWQRCCAAWASVHPETTDRREVDALSRNALRRLALSPLYHPG